jgi:CheY-like chemotaxis protein/HPt (histidine-containing phosphotransfer) domain-containing protein
VNDFKKVDILIVDDRPENLLALESLLEGPDLNIIKAGSGNEALGLMLKYEFALVLLDVQMPEMDGFETAELMRGTKKTRHIPIIFLTAISKEQRHVFKGYETGAVDYLFKPLEPEILKSKVKVFLDLYWQRKALERSTNNLKQTVAKLKKSEVELKKAKEAAEAATESKNEFLANLSHEIRTPLNTILGMEDLFRESPVTPEQEEYLAGICSSGEALLDLVDDIIDLSKLEAGCLKLEYIDFDLEERIEKTCQNMALRTRTKAVELSWKVMPGVPTSLIGDPARLHQILVNLIENVIKDAEKCKVVVKVSIADGVSKSSLKSKRRLMFSIRDIGGEIPRSETNEVSENFIEADDFSTRKYGEDGPGMNLSKRLIELMGGHVCTKNKEDPDILKPAGANEKFTIDCPERGVYFVADFQVQSEDKRQNPPQPAKSDDAAKDLKALNILVVEDNAQNLMLIKSYLKKTPYQINVSENGERAVTKFLSGEYDLVLMDIHMPVMDGYSATGAIRQWERENMATETPIIALSAAAHKEDLQKCLNSGFSAHLSKPIKKSKLIEAIEKYGRRHLEAVAGESQDAKQTSMSKPLRNKAQNEVDKVAAKSVVSVDRELKAIIPKFFEYTRKDIDSMRAALAQDDFETIRLLAHSIKGAGSGYGFDFISDVGRLLENAAKEKDAQMVDQQLVELFNYMERVEIVHE